MKTVADLFAYAPYSFAKNEESHRHFVQLERTLSDNGDDQLTYTKTVTEGHIDNEYWIAREKNLLLLLKKTPQIVRLRRDEEGTTFHHTIRTRDAGLSLDNWFKIRPTLVSDNTELTHPFQHSHLFLQLARGCLTALRNLHREGIIHANLTTHNFCLPYSPLPYDGTGALQPDFANITLIDFMFAVSSTLRLYRPLPTPPLAPPSWQSAQLRHALEQDQQSQRPDLIQDLDYSTDLYALGYLLDDLYQQGLVYPANMQSQLEMTVYNLIQELLSFDEGIPTTIRQKYGNALPHDTYIRRIDNMLALDARLEDPQNSQFHLDFTQPLTTTTEIETVSSPEPVETTTFVPSESVMEAPVSPTTAATPTTNYSYVEFNKWLIIGLVSILQVINFIYHEGNKMALDSLNSIALLIAVTGVSIVVLRVIMPQTPLWLSVEGVGMPAEGAFGSGTMNPAVPAGEPIELDKWSIIAAIITLLLCQLFFYESDKMGLDAISSILLTLVIGGAAIAASLWRRKINRPMALIPDDDDVSDKASVATLAPQPEVAPVEITPVETTPVKVAPAIVEAPIVAMAMAAETVATTAAPEPTVVASMPEMSESVSEEPTAQEKPAVPEIMSFERKPNGKKPQASRKDYIELDKWSVIAIIVTLLLCNLFYYEGDKMNLDAFGSILVTLGIGAVTVAGSLWRRKQTQPATTPEWLEEEQAAAQEAPVVSAAVAPAMATTAMNTAETIAEIVESEEEETNTAALNPSNEHINIDKRLAIIAVILIVGLLFFWNLGDLKQQTASTGSGSSSTTPPAPTEQPPAPVAEVPVTPTEPAPALPTEPTAIEPTPAPTTTTPSTPVATTPSTSTAPATVATRPAKVKKPATTATGTTSGETASSETPTTATTTETPTATQPTSAPVEQPKATATATPVVPATPQGALPNQSTVTNNIGNTLAQAQNVMGWHYYQGIGVTKDYNEAFRWFRKSAQLGDVNAQFNIGMMYASGIGTRQDYDEAAKWYRVSAEQGKSAAQLNFGMMYLTGRGVNQNFDEAAKWLRKSAAQGDRTAQATLDWLAKEGRISNSAPPAELAPVSKIEAPANP